MTKSQLNGAEQTAALLLDKLNGASVMIPGAFERRASASAVARDDSVGMREPDRAVTISARERLVYELEGGGAASERPVGRPASILQKIWRRMRQHPEVPERSRLFVSFPTQYKPATAHVKS